MQCLQGYLDIEDWRVPSIWMEGDIICCGYGNCSTDSRTSGEDKDVPSCCYEPTIHDRVIQIIFSDLFLFLVEIRTQRPCAQVILIRIYH